MLSVEGNMGNPILGTNVLCQVCFLTHDVIKTSKEWAEFLGVEVPEIINTGDRSETQVKYLGEESDARIKMAFFNVGENVSIELIEPDEKPSVWRDCLDKDGEGFHHIAFIVKGMKEKIEICGKQGFKLLQTGESPGGRYAYIDANDKLKCLLELLEND
jgi:4-hydroxyphenylpyruvate dioxygenase-like putative hemolysin